MLTGGLTTDEYVIAAALPVGVLLFFLGPNLVLVGFRAVGAVVLVAAGAALGVALLASEYAADLQYLVWGLGAAGALVLAGFALFG